MAHDERAIMERLHKSKGRCESTRLKATSQRPLTTPSRVAARFDFIAKGKPKVERMSIQTSISSFSLNMAVS
jgi:hypothetical protein